MNRPASHSVHQTLQKHGISRFPKHNRIFPLYLRYRHKKRIHGTVFQKRASGIHRLPTRLSYGNLSAHVPVFRGLPAARTDRSGLFFARLLFRYYVLLPGLSEFLHLLFPLLLPSETTCKKVQNQTDTEHPPLQMFQNTDIRRRYLQYKYSCADHQNADLTDNPIYALRSYLPDSHLVMFFLSVHRKLRFLLPVLPAIHT